MNIGSLFRGLLGDSRPGEAKSLELKEGQVVRGVVQSVSESGKEAVVQIQGTPVRAELETPLQPGQSLTLQVAPPGEGGLPVLKPVSLGEAALLSPQSMGEALETLGLKESKAGKEIIQAMQSGGLPLTKENAAKLDAIMNAKPQGVPTSEWLESAVLSVKRGLPVTAESVRGLQQAVFGPKLHELLAKLETELGAWVQQEEEKGNGKAGGPAVAGHAGTEGAVNENASGRSVTGPRTALGGAQGAANGLAEDAVLPAENEAGETAAAKGAGGKEQAGPGRGADGTQNNTAARTAAETAATALDSQSAEAAESAGTSGRPVKSGGAAEGAAAAAGTGNADDAGSAKSTGNAEGGGSAKSTGNAEGAGSAKSTGNAEGAGSAKSTGNAEGAGSAKSTGIAEGAGGASEHL
ncbi:hypothetical protein [Paenibacillus camerounensis]|uniref:hypothetical protein n=1 Tax=Paenibacillus camerounensis TaxID=1243663 RepID=UPI0006933BF2|nr:hypothetical protein [Paenibacillus camerounensis]